MLDQETTIARPEAPNHYMVLRPVLRQVVVRRGGETLADTNRAVRLLEHGRGLYDPVFYIPRPDTSDVLIELDKSTHCPLKGDASYFAMEAGGKPVAWTYSKPMAFAEVLKDYVAFYSDQVTVEERGG